MSQPIPVVPGPPPARPAEDELLPPLWTVALPEERFHLLTVRVPEARALPRAAFQEAAAGAYRRIEGALRDQRRQHPVRLWNHIPGIHDAMGGGQDRYMVFNAGRFEALAAWLGGRESFDTRLASASGVGHEGQDLVIHCLAADRPGRAVANPRQIAPHRYTRKYGPLPPCFARATVIDTAPCAPPLVFVGGTASIVGQSSLHPGNLARQIAETLTNLAVLLQAAGLADAASGDVTPAWLRCLRDIRVYYPRADHRAELERLLADAFPHLRGIEWVRADLCRAELLVEIEGVAQLEIPAISPIPSGELASDARAR
jgi:chorismate lyase/3-hydroxybenzoate synthase